MTERKKAGVNETNPSNNTDSDTDTLTPQADLAVTKDDGKTSVVPGTAETYTITVTNNGPSTVSFEAVAGIRAHCVTGVQTCALPICSYNSTTGVWSGLNLTSGSSVA